MFPSATTIRDTIRDLRDLLVSYAKQETIDPLRQLGRYLAFGLGGMALITLGVLLLGFALLRGLQTMTGGLLDGFWSWVPYLVVLLALSGVIAFAMARIGRELDHPGEGDL
ncbi:MAG: phage holin family protein [Acidobacteria bacterium]|nr:phage holin family protein [Acidobacteriota bacterium]